MICNGTNHLVLSVGRKGKRSIYWALVWQIHDYQNYDACYGGKTSLVAQTVNHLPIMQETWVRSLGREDPLEKEMATHSSTLAWKIPWTEEPGELQSMGSQWIKHDWATSLYFLTFMEERRNKNESLKWQKSCNCRNYTLKTLLM